MIKIFTDGSTLSNGKKNNEGGFGVVVYKDEKIIDCYSKREINTTNNICEMKAILYAIIKYGKLNPIIYTDSSYALNAFTIWRHSWKENGWKKANGDEVKNLELIQAFDKLIELGYKIRLEKVKGHANCEGNILADKLATAQITMQDIMGGKING